MLLRRSSLLLSALASRALAQLDTIPEGFDTDRWVWVSNQDPLLAVIPGKFNRTVYDAPSAANISDERVVAMSVCPFNSP